MSEPLKGLALGLVAFLLVDVVAAAAVAFARPWLEGREGQSAERRARLLFLLRLLPGTAALVAVAALFVPAYLAHEPPGGDEVVGAPVVALAGLSALVIASAARRGSRSWRATRRLTRTWNAAADPVALPTAGLRAFLMTHRFPVVSVLGVRRPRLYVARQVLAALSEAELAAVLDHEQAHVAARDNLRHWLIGACPDVLAWLPAGAALDRAWLAAAEEAADERAARRGRAAALALAEALVKVARLVPDETAAPVPFLALHNGDDLARRIRRLLGTTPAAEKPRPVRGRLAVLLLFAAFVPGYAPALRVVHGLTERLVLLLS
jgi:Zn-dependent protease with chaperone function